MGLRTGLLLSFYAHTPRHQTGCILTPRVVSFRVSCFRDCAWMRGAVDRHQAARSRQCQTRAFSGTAQALVQRKWQRTAGPRAMIESLFTLAAGTKPQAASDDGEAVSVVLLLRSYTGVTFSAHGPFGP
jgi:hypothetical protein